MTDVTAFERQLSGEIRGLMGPIRPVDDLAVYDAAIVASRSRSWGLTMFSALRAVAAAGIVALFGGFLVAGLLSSQPEDAMAPAAATASPAAKATSEPTEGPTTSVRTDILPGVVLTVEEVEPGVFRVVNDSVSDFAFPLDPQVPYDIVAGHDGGIYILEPGHFARLGEGGGSAQGHKGFDWNFEAAFPSDVDVDSDGTIWAVFGDAGDRHLYSTHWGSGQETRELLTTDGPGPIEIAPDGTVWAAWRDDAEDLVFGYLGAGGWSMVGEWPVAPVWGDGSALVDGYLRVSDRGEVWALGIDGSAQHFIDGAWQSDGPRLVRKDYVALPAGDVGVDGTLWGLKRDRFVRFDGTEWSTFEPPDWVPTEVTTWELAEDAWAPGLVGVPRDSSITAEDSRWGEPHVAPDGSLWVPLRLGVLEGDPDLGGGAEPICDDAIDGVVRFDGKTWSRFLRGRCVESVDVAADGSVWLLASKSDARYPLAHVFVVTPEAVEQ